MMMFELREEILMLIDSKREDDYWDFKVKYHSNSANLLHDIICMANNRVDRDAYIIFGVVDGTYEVVGVKDDENRKTQQQMIDLLKDKKFVSGIRPRVEVRNLMISGLEVDVLVIKNSTDTPYYLTEDYQDQGRRVRANHIYTRVGDTNTDINRSADINNVEYLWKKRFLLTRSPFEQVIKRLENKSEWKSDDGGYYNVYNPEFTITIGDEDDEYDRRIPEFYSYALMNSSTSYQKLSIKYFGTQLYNDLIVVLDGGRYSTPAPEWAFLKFREHKVHADYALKYFTKDSASFKLNEFLYNEEDQEEAYARSRFFEVVLLFNDELEKDTFLEYVHHHKDDFINKLNALDDHFSVDADTEHHRDHIVERLKTGKVLNQMLLEFRSRWG
ncbi:DNA-binding protein [Paenibacillus sp. CCS19]|uniref:ATP-binding protein n=1 Tax=Paenibacillus sp. CCS19 TaxID=3158387 RepID=UPI00256A6EEB|nr:ATP-binding protein [Paenibacillus cellulosilyticus]GMK39098.1 DNA-binding protein [Paenibacillus cellulosilyticus]